MLFVSIFNDVHSANLSKVNYWFLLVMCVVLLTYRHFTLMGVVWANRHLTLMVSSLYLSVAPFPSLVGCRRGRRVRHTGTASGHSGSPRPRSTSAYRSDPWTSPATHTHTHSDHLGLFRGNTCTYTLGSFRIIHGKYLHTYTLVS